MRNRLSVLAGADSLQWLLEVGLQSHFCFEVFLVYVLAVDWLNLA